MEACIVLDAAEAKSDESPNRQLRCTPEEDVTQEINILSPPLSGKYRLKHVCKDCDRSFDRPRKAFFHSAMKCNGCAIYCETHDCVYTPQVNDMYSYGCRKDCNLWLWKNDNFVYIPKGEYNNEWFYTFACDAFAAPPAPAPAAST